MSSTEDAHAAQLSNLLGKALVRLSTETRKPGSSGLEYTGDGDSAQDDLNYVVGEFLQDYNHNLFLQQRTLTGHCYNDILAA